MSYDSLLTDTCTVVRRTSGTFNPATGAHDATDTEVYVGVCRASPSPSAGRRIEVGEEAVIDRARWVFLPRGTTGILPEDIVTVTASRDADVIGREMTVKDVAAEASPMSVIIARWLICEDIQEGSP